jgi:hypothetical protein
MKINGIEMKNLEEKLRSGRIPIKDEYKKTSTAN